MTYSPLHPCCACLPCQVETCIFFEECDFADGIWEGSE